MAFWFMDSLIAQGLHRALELGDNFPVYHEVSHDSISDMWRVLLYLIVKRKELQDAFENRPDNLDKSKRQLIAEFDRAHPKVLPELAGLWNRILAPAGLSFDVDGAHIASLLITFFYRMIPQLVETGHLYLAVPPLYKLTQGAKTAYARDDQHKDELMESEFNGRGKVEVGRFKGLGEMMPQQLKETTMRPGSRTLLRVVVEDDEAKSTGGLVETLMGRKPELRFKYIQENAMFVEDIDI